MILFLLLFLLFAVNPIACSAKREVSSFWVKNKHNIGYGAVSIVMAALIARLFMVQKQLGETRNDLSDANDDHQTEKDVAIKKYEDLEVEKNTVQQKFDDLKNNISSETEKVKLEISNLEVQKRVLADEILSMHMEKIKLFEALSKKLDECAERIDRVKTIKAGIGYLDSKISMLKQDIPILEQQEDQKQKEKQNLESKISHLIAELEKQSDVLAGIKNEKDTKEKIVEEKKELYRKVEGEIKQLKAEKTVIEGNLSQVNSELKTILQEIKNLNYSVETVQQQKVLAEEELLKLSTQKNTLENDLFQLNTQTQELINQISGSKLKLETEIKRYDQYNTEYTGTIKQVQNYQSNNESLENELLTLNRQVVDLEKASQKKKEQVEEWRTKATGYQEMITRLDSEIAGAKKYNDELRDQIDNLRDEKKSLSNNVLLPIKSLDNSVKELYEFVKTGKIDNFKQTFDSIIPDNSDTGVKYLTSVIQPIFVWLISIEYKYHDRIIPVFKHILMSEVFLISFVSASLDSSCQREFRDVLTDMEKISKKIHDWSPKKYDIYKKFYEFFFEKTSNAKIHYFVLNSLMKQLYFSRLSDMEVKEFFKLLICTMTTELKQCYFDECLNNLYLYSSNNVEIALFFNTTKHQIDFLLCLFNDYGAMFDKKDTSFLTFTREQFQQSLSFPELFKVMVFCMQQNFPNCISNYFDSLQYDEKKVDEKVLKTIQQYKTNQSNQLSDIKENNSQNNSFKQVDDLKGDITGNQNQRKNQRIEIVESKKNNDKLCDQIDNLQDTKKDLNLQCYTINEKSTFGINGEVPNNVERKPGITNDSQLKNESIAIINIEKSVERKNNEIVKYSESVKALCDFIKRDKQQDFKNEFNAVVDNDNSTGYLSFIIKPVFIYLSNSKNCRHPGFYIEYVLLSERFLSKMNAAFNWDKGESIVIAIFDAIQSVTKRNFYNKEIIVASFFGKLFKLIKPNTKVPYPVLNAVMAELKQQEAHDVLKIFICQMSAALKQQYFNEVLDNLYNQSIHSTETLFFQTKQQQIQFLNCLCDNYGERLSNDTISELKNVTNTMQEVSNQAFDDMHSGSDKEHKALRAVKLSSFFCNPYSLSFTKEQFQQMLSFPALFKVIVSYMRCCSLELLGEYYDALQYDEKNINQDLLKMIQKYTIPKKLLKNKQGKKWFSALKESASNDLDLSFYFISSMTSGQCLQFAQFQVFHFLKKIQITTDRVVNRTGYYIGNKAHTLLASMQYNDFLEASEEYDKHVCIKDQLRFIVLCDPVIFFLLAFRTQFCFNYCQNRSESDSCGVKAWLKKHFFDESQQMKIFSDIWNLYDVFRDHKYQELKAIFKGGADTKRIKEQFRLIKKSALEDRFKARFYQVCCDWLCEDKSVSHDDFIQSLNRVWRATKKGSPRVEQMSRDGEVLKIPNCAEDRYYRCIFNLSELNKEKTYQKREERLRVIQQYNLDPVCSVDEVVTRIHNFPKSLGAIAALQ